MEILNFFKLNELAGFLSLLAHVWYIGTILFGSTRPSKSSWWILGFVWLVVFASSVDLAPGETLDEKLQNCAGGYLTLVYVVGAFVIAVLSVVKGEKDTSWKILDYMCAVGAVMSVVCYLVVAYALPVHYMVYTLIISLIADVFGIIPTVKNAWKNPDKEDIWAWGIEWLSSTIAVFAITRWTMYSEGVSDWASPLYLFLGNGSIFFSVVLGKIRDRKKR
jgi:hypothetical protein